MAWVGISSRKFYERSRRYAILVIAIIAAMLTPTPDVFNMAMMCVPLYMLYEAGDNHSCRDADQIGIISEYR